MLYWPILHGIYLAPFPEECRHTLHVRLCCTGQDLYVAPEGIILLIITLFIMGKGGLYGPFMAWRMYALYRVPSS